MRPLRDRSSAFARRAARSVAARTGNADRFAELESVFDRGYGRNRRDDAATLSLLPVALAGGRSAIDVGANVGDILEAVVRAAPDAHHVAFEPIPELAADLARRFPQVELHEVACSDEPGRTEFTVVVDAPALSGLRQREDLGAYAGNVRKIEVQLERLDDVIDPELAVGLVKVDVEGAEVKVLRGAQQLLRRHRPAVVFEHGSGGADLYGSTSAELYDLLDDCGLRVFDLAGDGPIARQRFIDDFTSPERWNWLAVAR